MCGIAGFNWNDPPLVEKMNEVLRHRGPDDEGCYLDESVSLGHRRLSVIDTSERGHQPMEFEHLVIAYNGEVYNFMELREQLKSAGYNFSSDTDTEVVLYSYHHWGPSCVEKFNGMWAFCIYDKKENILFLSRDRFGIKPLYYYFDGEKFIFASELKAIRCHGLDLKINTSALNFYFYQKYIGNGLAIFENCYKLRPSENLTFDLKRKQVSKTSYYDLEREIARSSVIPVEERIRSVESTLVSAVEKRLVADVPVGAFLSGGVDSSLVSAIIAQRKSDFDTFSIGFKEQSYDEVPYSRAVSAGIGTDHHVEYMEIDEPVIEHVLGHIDEPFGDPSLLPTYLLSRITRRNVTVSLSGDGGDEVFGGYDTYQAYKLAQFVPNGLVRALKPVADLLPPSERKLGFAFKVKKFTSDFGADINKRHLDWMSTFNDGRRSELLKDKFASVDSFINLSRRNGLVSIQLNDIYNYLTEDILKKVDTASMLNSLEARVPFLDHRLVPLVLSLPAKYKIRFLRTKWLLKKIALDYLPTEIVRRKKRGFTVPVSAWVKKSGLIREFIENRHHYEHGLLNYDYVQNLLDEHINNRNDNARQLWLVFVFNYWAKANLYGSI